MIKKIRWIDRELIVSPYHICLCQDEKSFKTLMKKLKVSEPPLWIAEGAAGQVHRFEPNEKENTLSLICIVCIRPDKKRDYLSLAGLLIHEAVHVWQLVAECIAERDPSWEFEAYSIQHIAEQLLRAHKEKK